MSLHGRNRTASLVKERPSWTRRMKTKSVPKTFTVDTEVSEALDKNYRQIKFKYGSISQYMNYLVAKDLGLTDENNNRK